MANIDLMNEVGAFNALMSSMLPRDRYSFVVAMKYSKEMMFKGNLMVSEEDGDVTTITTGLGAYSVGSDSYAYFNSGAERYFVAKKVFVDYYCVKYRNKQGKMVADHRTLLPNPFQVRSATQHGVLLPYSDGEIHWWSLPHSGKMRRVSGPRVRTAMENGVMLERIARYTIRDLSIPLSYPLGFVMIYCSYFGHMPPNNLPGGTDWKVAFIMRFWRHRQQIDAMADSFNSEPTWSLEHRLSWVEFSHYTHLPMGEVTWDSSAIYVSDPIGRVIYEKYLQTGARQLRDESRLIKIIDDTLPLSPPPFKIDTYHDKEMPKLEQSSSISHYRREFY